MSALLEVKDLKTYFYLRRGVVKAVDGVSFCLNERETLALIGESGCGKTVTCLSILRLVPPPAGRIVGGEIIFLGEDLLKKSRAQMRKIRGKMISMIVQDPMTSLNPLFTIGDQVAESIRIHQKTRRRNLWQQVIDVLKLVRIPSPEVRLRDYPHQMSGGMRQRVVGAIAISCQPRLLIADEPTTSLDVTIQDQYLYLLKEIQQQLQAAMIFVTHDFGIVANMCDRVAVMYAGKIVECAEVRELFNNPAHPYTVALLRSLPRMDVRLEKLSSIDGQPPSLINLPPGCSFAPRCSIAESVCYQQCPPSVSMSQGHTANCWKRA